MSPHMYAFFRAPGPDAVRAAFAAGPALHDPATAFETLRPVGADPGDVLELLDELVLTRPGTDLIDHTVWPSARRPHCFTIPGDPWTTGPWTHQLTPTARDLLAETPTPALLALRPHGHTPPTPALIALPTLTPLARRAAAAGEQLYYWLEHEN
ncbi:hypothetical protein [Kitasatospora sp. NPDC057198]|uniref:hypothetical protein n=1 Tax=Kitasatospora sp. NPDC057198 TaxID=3346046 RepID=UPI00363E1596